MLVYTARQILNAFRHPKSVKYEIQNQIKKIHQYLPHDIGVHGSYQTGNVGDRAIGEAFLKYYDTHQVKVKLFDKSTEQSIAPVRILGGGGVLHDWYGIDHLKKRLNFVSDNGAIIGIGVPGFKSEKSRRLVSNKLSNIELITVRDDWSHNRLKQVYDGQIYTTACPAFLHREPEYTSNYYTGVNFRPWFHLDPEIMNFYFEYEKDIDCTRSKETYLNNIKRICEKVPNPVFIPFHKKDEIFAREYLNIDIYPYKFSVKKTLERVNGVDQMVAMRYHSLVFAAICNKPTLAIGYEPKVTHLAKRLDIPSYKPHNQILVEFGRIDNINSVRNCAENNFEMLDKHIYTEIDV